MDVGDNYIGNGILDLEFGNYSLVEKLGLSFQTQGLIYPFPIYLSPKSTHNLLLANGAIFVGEEL